MSWNGLVMLAVVALCLPLYWILARLVFETWDCFLESVIECVKPALWKLFEGGTTEHGGSPAWLAIFAASCVCVTLALYHVIATFLLRLPNPWNF